jgi:hypothetical protein
VVGSAAMLAPPEKLPEGNRAASLVPPIPVPAGRPDRNSAPRPPELSAEEKERTEKLVAHGRALPGAGQHRAGARVLPPGSGRRAGAGRSPSGRDLRPLRTRAPAGAGVVPDRAEARKWYERARELGAPEAEERLAKFWGELMAVGACPAHRSRTCVPPTGARSEPTPSTIVLRHARNAPEQSPWGGHFPRCGLRFRRKRFRFRLKTISLRYAVRMRIIERRRNPSSHTCNPPGRDHRGRPTRSHTVFS